MDIDGTIANYHKHFFRFAAQWLGDNEDWEYWDDNYHGGTLNKFMGLDKRTYRQIKLAYRQGGMKRSMPPMHGYVELFDTLKELDVEIWLTTTRPYLQIGNVDDDTREWLRRQQVPYDHLLYSDNKYSELVAQVGLDRVVCVLDDQVWPEYMDAQGLGLNPVLVLSKYNSPYGNQVESFAEGLVDASLIVAESVHEWRERYALA